MKDHHSYCTTRVWLFCSSLPAFLFFLSIGIHRVYDPLQRNYRVFGIGVANRLPRPCIHKSVTVATVIRTHLQPVNFTTFATTIRALTMQTPKENGILVPWIMQFLPILHRFRNAFWNFLFRQFKEFYAVTQIQPNMHKSILWTLPLTTTFLLYHKIDLIIGL